MAAPPASAPRLAAKIAVIAAKTARLPPTHIPSLVLAFRAALRPPVPTLARCAGWAKARCSSPQRRRCRVDAAALVDEAVRPIAGEQERSVEIDHARALGHQQRRRHGERG